MNLWGIHAPNSWGDPPQAEIDAFLGMGVSNHVMLDSEAWLLPQMRKRSPDGILEVRMYQADWRALDPVQWAEHCVNEYNLLRTDPTGLYPLGWSWASIEAHLTPANEMNLEPTLRYSEQDYRDINTWLVKWFHAVAGRIPRERLHWPALAYGHSDDDSTAGYCGMEICRESINLFGILDVHPYWHAVDEVLSQWFGHRFILAHNLFPDKPIFLSEAGGFGCGLRASMAAEIVQWFESLYQYTYIIGAVCFIFRDPTGKHGENDWGKDRNIEAEVKAARKQALGGVPLPPQTPSQGLWLWVWYWDANYIQMARRIGARGLLVKAADGGQPWSQWSGAAAAIRDAGLEAVPWAYNYGDPQEVDALLATGEGTICVDPEIEFERLSASAQQRFIARLQVAKAQGHTIWCACWARPDAHPGYPFGALADVCEAMVPMIAWQVWDERSWLAWYDHWDTFGYRGFPWLPSSEGVTPAELAASVKDALRRYGTATIWEASLLSPEMVAALTPDPSQAIIDALNGIWHNLDVADAAIDEVRTRVVLLKKALGLQPS